MSISFLKHKAPLKILFVGAEAAPFIKVGGLGEVLRSLPHEIRELGHDARIFIPKYAKIDVDEFPMQLEASKLNIAPGEKDPHGLFVCNVLSHTNPKDKSISYFLENMEYFEKRANAYGYNDDTIRWVLLSKGALAFIRQSEWKPDIIVASDWQTGFVPNLLETEMKDDPVLSKIATLFSIHNLKYQGMFDAQFVAEIDADSGQGLIPDFLEAQILKLNGMRRGILYADTINTVSPTYAKEILTPEYGVKLNEILKSRREDLYGILNGVDYDKENPATNENLAANYTSRDLAERKKNKIELQRRVGLPQDEDIHVIGFVNRLTDQKGINLISDIAPSLFQNLKFQFVLVGSGDSKYKEYFQKLAETYPDRVAVHLTYDEILPKLIFSGADTVLVPSKFEPSGLVQMEAMRYGAIPIVRRTGGLADSVEDYVPGEKKGTGFVFQEYDPYALLIAVVRAWQAYRNKKEWQGLMKRAMSQDFSWQKSAKEYITLCYQTVEKHAKAKKAKTIK